MSVIRAMDVHWGEHIDDSIPCMEFIREFTNPVANEHRVFEIYRCRVCGEEITVRQESKHTSSGIRENDEQEKDQ